MTFVFTRVHKGKPDWVDWRPRASARDAYKIAARYEQDFSRAFIKAMTESMPKHPPRALVEAWHTNDTNKVIAELPLMSPLPTAPKAQQRAWDTFFNELKQAYLDVLKASGHEAARALKEQLNLKVDFQWNTVDDAEVLKAADPDRWLNPIVPINPFAERWTEERCMELVTQGITDQQREVATRLIQDNFKRGMRVERMYSELQDNIGLTVREYTAVANRYDLVISSGAPEALAKQTASAYAKQLLKKRAERIARTETIQAQAEGRRALWRSTEESGNMPPVEREWITAPGSANPDRPCEICLSLDGENAPINGMYNGSTGPMEGPTAHPHCRCTETLVRVEE